MLRGVGPSTLRKITDVDGFENAPIGETASKVPALARALKEDGVWDAAEEEAERQVGESVRFGGSILSPLDAEYPPLLAATSDDPFILFVRGQLAAAETDTVAVIGTREPTGHGGVIAERVARYFADRRWSVVSGLALGCDAIAHRAALTVGGHTVAVLAHGLQMIAPLRHVGLADEILKAGGALVSEYRYGQDAKPQQFVRRDKAQAGLSRAVVMIQSDVEGGSLHASRAALAYGRRLVVPYPTERDRDAREPKIGANLLISEGDDEARAKLLRCEPADLERVVVIRGRDDYDRMAACIAEVEAEPNALVAASV
jgi:DNA processing protein